MGSTKVELVAELRRLPPSAARTVLIDRARSGVYHDFESEHACPKMELVADLERAAGFMGSERSRRELLELVGRVKAGDFDDEGPGGS